jgi:hypothetical protein
VDRRCARCRERDAVPGCKRVAHVVLFVVEDPGLDPVLAMIHEFAADPGLAVMLTGPQQFTGASSS